MCGIAGFVDHKAVTAIRDKSGRTRLLDRMCNVISHRGPDDQGMLVEDAVALGMRRLSIIDLAGGHQPMSGEGGLVNNRFNGGIYNYRELQVELEASGHKFRTNSDT